MRYKIYCTTRFIALGWVKMMILSSLQIVKQEWPRNWPTFISDIVGASKTSESLCTNNMAVLKLLR